MIVFNHTNSDFNYAKNDNFYNIPAFGFADIDEATGITAEELVACYGTRISIKEKLEDNNGENYNEIAESISNGEKEDETEDDNGTTTDSNNNTKDEVPEVKDEVKEDTPVVDDNKEEVKEDNKAPKQTSKKAKTTKSTTKKK